MDSIVQHFRRDEQPFIEMAMGWVREVEDSYSPKLTGFMDPRQRFILQSITGGTDLLLSFQGAFPEAERQRALLYPNYFSPRKEDFHIVVFNVKYATKFLNIEHKDVLGSMMALGVDRSIFGDIRVADEAVQFTVSREMKDYVIANFTAIGKAKILLKENDAVDTWLLSTDSWLEETHIVSSLRLDVVIASLTKLSRQKAASLIHGEKVKVNWTVIEQPAFDLQESDMLSVRGWGRYKIIAIEGRTKKDKIRLIVGKLQ